MKTNVLVAFAMKEEFAPWRRRNRFRPISISSRPAFVTSLGSIEAYVALVGAGAPDAQCCDDLIQRFNPSMAIVTGVAAGLKSEWRPGDLLAAQSVGGTEGEASISGDPGLINLAVHCGAKPAPRLITLPRIARTIKQKSGLASLGDAADMESLVLMRQWSSRGIPALALRVILDPVEIPMNCDFEASMDVHGQVKITRIIAQLARRPQLLPDFFRLAGQSRRSLRALARFLDQFLERFDSQPLSPPDHRKGAPSPASKL